MSKDRPERFSVNPALIRPRANALDELAYIALSCAAEAYVAYPESDPRFAGLLQLTRSRRLAVSVAGDESCG